MTKNALEEETRLDCNKASVHGDVLVFNASKGISGPGTYHIPRLFDPPRRKNMPIDYYSYIQRTAPRLQPITKATPGPSKAPPIEFSSTHKTPHGCTFSKSKPMRTRSKAHLKYQFNKDAFVLVKTNKSMDEDNNESRYWSSTKHASRQGRRGVGSRKSNRLSAAGREATGSARRRC